MLDRRGTGKLMLGLLLQVSGHQPDQSRRLAIRLQQRQLPEPQRQLERSAVANMCVFVCLRVTDVSNYTICSGRWTNCMLWCGSI